MLVLVRLSSVKVAVTPRGQTPAMRTGAQLVERRQAGVQSPAQPRPLLASPAPAVRPEPRQAPAVALRAALRARESAAQAAAGWAVLPRAALQPAALLARLEQAALPARPEQAALLAGPEQAVAPQAVRLRQAVVAP